MEDPLPHETQQAVVDENLKTSESAENFQKFIFDLFDKNGILNDLRAYLRGHIVNVLSSAQTGEPPACQKHFTQRLDLTFQALNMLVAEYLLRLEFNYSFSVFISEIPLANMVFEFAKTLMQNGSSENIGLQFKDRDVWSILNNLGVKCDSQHASSILEMYKSQECCPLLLCILKNMPMYNKDSVHTEQANFSNNSIASSRNSSESFEERPTKESYKKSSFHDKCRHYKSCKTCENKITRVKEKYTRSKKNFAKNIKDTKLEPQNVESLMKNISVLERSLIDEMFQQVKTVYETEVEMVRDEQQKRVKRSLANHALQLQQRHHEMEKSFKDREAELESNVQQKKKFLWGLARALRVQHEHMTRAMHDVRLETARLTDKEESLKTQLAEAEQVLRQRGEEMRSQISNELTILETHLESMRNERESINRERSELGHLKFLCETRDERMKIDSDDLKPHYELLKDELSILRKYIETTRLEPKCVIERSTMTELGDVRSKLSFVLNNGRDAGYMRSDESTVGNGHVVNDLKKQKNVNFSQSNLDEIYRERSRERSRSSASSEAGDSVINRESLHQRDVLHQLEQENDRLKAFATQQREHIDELSSQQARLQAELMAERYRPASEMYQQPPLVRPRTAPAYMPQSNYFLHRVNASASSNTVNYGWRKGAGEELSLFTNAQPRIYLPGDTVPFIGVLRDRHSDNRRHLINQWRMLRRRASPVRVISKHRTSPAFRGVRERPVSAGPSLNKDRATHEQDDREIIEISNGFSRQSDTRERQQQAPRNLVTLDINKNREKSPKSVLREAKDKLRNKDNNTKARIQTGDREKSPSSVLREAKLRLRKLEIEAEAVEKSYMEFRNRQSQLRNENQTGFDYATEESFVGGYENRNLDIQKSVPVQKINVSHDVDRIQHHNDVKTSIKTDFDKYLREYKTMSGFNVNFRNRNLSIDQTKPIPETYSIIDGKDKYKDYIETPLNEFRKLYQSRQPEHAIKETRIKTLINSPDNSKSGKRNNSVSTESRENRNEQELLNQNISDSSNLPRDTVKTTGEEVRKVNLEAPDDNLLRVEVENVSAVSGVKLTESQTRDILVVVESASDSGEIKSMTDDGEKISAKMTIIVSPNRCSPEEPNAIDIPEITKSVSPEPNINDTNDVLNDIFHADDKDVSSAQMGLELSKDVLDDGIISEDENGDEEYRDDFSADVDNYNIRSEYENNSPVSLPKTSEDENFWDS